MRHPRRISDSRERKGIIANNIAVAWIGSFAVGITGLANADLNYDRYAAHQAALDLESGKSEAVSKIASDMAGKAIRAHCGEAFFEPIERSSESAQPLGYMIPYKIILPFGENVLIASDDIYLRQTVCRHIVSAVESESLSDVPSIGKSASYLKVLSHEIEHTFGVMNEAEADCYALQRLPEQLEAAGFSSRESDRLVSTYLVNPQFTMPAEYVSSECREGGAFDLGIE